MRKLLFCLLFLAPSTTKLVGEVHEQVIWSPEYGNIASVFAIDSKGNLYGADIHGGNNFAGSIFEVSPNADGSWTATTLYDFCPNYPDCPDGFAPVGLIIGTDGNLYGTTGSGGTGGGACGNENGGCGVLFELSRPVNGGPWTETVLHAFGGGADGASPNADLIFDSHGSLYGTTNIGGQGIYEYESGTVFKLSYGNSGWSNSVLYSFCVTQNCPDGANPAAGVRFDKFGNLYGTTSLGGAYQGGTFFELSPGSNGWTEKVLVNVISPPFRGPVAPVAFNGNGEFYALSDSLIFLINPQTGRVASEPILSNQAAQEMISPSAPVIVDPRRALFGTGFDGGLYHMGVFWAITGYGEHLQLFNFGGADGVGPGNVIEDKAGNFYGTTYSGGVYGQGAVFKINLSR